MKTGTIVTTLGLTIISISTLLLSAKPQEKNPTLESGPFRIGATIPLTGDYASYGRTISSGAELAREDLKKEGIEIELFYEDVPLPGPRANTAIRNLISIHKIEALGANYFNPAMLTMAPVVNQANIPAFHTSAIDNLNLNNGNNVVSTNSKMDEEANLLAEYARNTLKAKTASVIHVNSIFGEQYTIYFRERFEKLGGKVIDFDSTEIGETNIHPLLSRVKGHKPDIIFAAYFGLNMGLVLKQARELGIDQRILGDYETEDPSVIETAGPAAEGVEFFAPEPIHATEKQIEFKKRFKNRFGYDANVFATNSYDAITLLGRSLKECKRNSKCTLEKVYSGEYFDGISGQIQIGADGGTKKEFVLKTIKNGKFVRAPYRPTQNY